MGLPSEADREAIFRIHLRRSPLGADISFKNLANLTEGCTGADIFSVCQTAGFIALEVSFSVFLSMFMNFNYTIEDFSPYLFFILYKTLCIEW